MTEKSPAFQFYPKDFLTDEKVVAMSLEEVGAYTLLLCQSWMEAGLPDDIAILSKICRVSKKKMEAIWTHVGRCFSVDLKTGRLINPRQERDRTALHEFQESRRNAANTRWHKQSTCETDTRACGDDAGSTVNDIGKNENDTNNISNHEFSQVDQVNGKSKKTLDQVNARAYTQAMHTVCSSSSSSSSKEETPLPPLDKLPELPTGSWTPDWSRLEAIYPGEIAPDRDCRIFLSIIQTPTDEERLHANLRHWSVCEKWRKGFIPRLDKFLWDGQWKTMPPPDRKAGENEAELARLLEGSRERDAAREAGNPFSPSTGAG